MAFDAWIRNGCIVFDEAVLFPDGTVLRVEQIPKDTPAGAGISQPSCIGAPGDVGVADDRGLVGVPKRMWPIRILANQ
jgi:hypothetical protein